MIGLFGGTFDPVHFGHLRPALEVMQALRLTEMRFIPCRLPPHRDLPMASAGERLAMLRLAIDGQPGFRVDDRELRREGPSYMVDTLKSLRDEDPQRRQVLILGQDAFAGLPQWHDWQSILALTHLVVVHRPGTALERLYRQPQLSSLLSEHRVDTVEVLHESMVGGIYFQPVTALDISATRIRACLASGESARFLLPALVNEYVTQRNLYR